MNHVVVRVRHRPPAALVQGLSPFGVATVHESMGRRGLMKPYMRGIRPGARLCGPAVTVLSHPGDNLMMHAAVEQCGPGDVLVVTTTSESTDGMFGELLATSLRSRGVAGLVIEAGVRDVAELNGMDFPVWSRAVSAQGTVKATAGSVNVPVVVAGAHVRPSDVVVADDDGVVVVPAGELADVVDAATRREALEAQKRAALADGTLGLDLYSLRERLTALGVRYVDEEETR
ncbi:4-carboxy-4-hydroxy-2-oxoadipate aldolase/oxaloacetate decarboxylase [Streptomyces sp. NBC_01754]|uniref:4-carboxy-4-hydroxy-2-oxoadipate aldolase/oxaloacetate decarboxylase n=1 Tax=Streptomyces sp. NBC_01754 TaxID=2975930 RepID=UPI002DD838D4|nr:4-carboxy-4-hydroxy-2-oxoadipate aldolase/oxaloacetate decarboxylase [Streptomyces sp. NBC_01754]WSC96393.1 4-carboxy-4-hydroxy-2-oxoadipate aldolase/oxaloacetate decarboxylase [Streptomyces sp. NBC_01754]